MLRKKLMLADILMLLSMMCFSAESYAGEEYFEAVKKEAALGDAAAQYELGTMLFDESSADSQNNEIALDWFRKSAEQGDADAQAQLAYLYQVGKGLPLNLGEAVKWYRKAADQRHTVALANLAYMYWKGTGVPANCEEAIKLYRKSAEQGWMEAQHNLGIIYFIGDCGPADYMNAYIWMNVAYYQGAEMSKNVLDKIAQKMSQDQIERAQEQAAEIWENIRSNQQAASRNSR